MTATLARNSAQTRETLSQQARLGAACACARTCVYLRVGVCMSVCARARGGGITTEFAADNRSHARSSESGEPLKDRARSHGVAQEEALLPVSVAVRLRAVSAAAARVGWR